ncbi:PGF-pre-PGF domain-containing protein [Halolamina sediminis]|uniref:PGF-pre-PGF domain-containing protein n=1 Tax=Halolamina sediminis TaxID=1480675 RepID=UPI0006B4456E|nr:PGF-pre-PGF domain-containing protein [Halolamina sediminis]
MNRRTLTLAIAFVVAGTLAFPSAAAPLFDGPTDQLGSDVELAPSSDYAYLDGDDELVVDLSPSNPAIDGEGVNADGRTTIGDVFRVRYNGSRYADVWLTHGSDAVTFAVDGQPIESPENNVTLAPNESAAISLTVDTTGGAVDGLVDDITIHARVAEPEEQAEENDDEIDGVSTLSSAPSGDSRKFTSLSAEPGKPVNFDTSRLPLDRVDGEALTFDGLSVTSPDRTFSVIAEATEAGEAQSSVVDDGADPLGAVRMTVRSGNVSNATMRFSAPPSYFRAQNVDPANLAVYRHSDGELSRVPVTATGERDGRLTFEAVTPGFSTFIVAVDRPRLSVTDASLDTNAVAPGEPATVSAAVVNDGTLAGERTVRVTVDGTVAAERTVAVPPGERETVSVPIVRNETGEYAVAVAGSEAGTVRVVAEERSTAVPSETATASAASTAQPTQSPVGEASGFGLRALAGLVGLLVIVAATLLLARRTPQP